MTGAAPTLSDRILANRRTNQAQNAAGCAEGRASMGRSGTRAGLPVGRLDEHAHRPDGERHYRAVVISRDDVEAAQHRIAAHVRRTPVTVLEAGDLLPGIEVALKLEQLQHTGSFKARGALNRVLAAAERG